MSELETEINHPVSFLSLKFPALLRACFFPPLFFFLMKMPSKTSFFHQKRAAGRCFHRVPPCSGRAWRGCGPNGGFGDSHSPFFGGLPLILQVSGQVCSPECCVRARLEVETSGCPARGGMR